MGNVTRSVSEDEREIFESDLLSCDAVADVIDKRKRAQEQELLQKHKLQERTLSTVFSRNCFQERVYESIISSMISLGVLSLVGTGLASFPDELLHMIEDYLDEEKLQREQDPYLCGHNGFSFQITEINLSGNMKMQEFPLAVFHRLHKRGVLKDVYELSFNNTGLVSGESMIGHISAVDCVGISCEDVCCVYCSWKNMLPNLTKLTAHSNNVEQFPDSFGRLPNLIHLDLSSNPIIGPSADTFLPFLCDPNKCNLSSLRVLKLGNCQQMLDQHGNEQSFNVTIPASFFEIHQKTLKHLQLEENNIISFCHDTSENCIMSCLVNISLHDNRLIRLSSSVFCGRCLPRLKNLNLENNMLSELPDEFCTISSLQRLHMANNKLLSLPNSFGALRMISRLELAHNKLKSLPCSMAELHYLTYLDLTNNELTHISDSLLLGWSSLKELGLAGNKLSNETLSIPLIWRAMPNLTYLNLGFNRFASFIIAEHENESIISGLNNLESLILTGNRITEMTTQITYNQQLKQLYIGHNRLEKFDPSILMSLCQLTHLSLCGNQLTDAEVFPKVAYSECYGFRNLRFVDLSHNRFEFRSERAESFLGVLQNNNNNAPELILSSNLTNLATGQNDGTEFNLTSVSSGTAHICGDRPSMEDTFIIQKNLIPSYKDLHVQLYAIFDGHSGRNTSQYVAENFPGVVSRILCEQYKYSTIQDIISNAENTLVEAIATIDEQVKQQEWLDGCTAVITLILNHSRCVVANVGDSRIVRIDVINDTVTGTRITMDHKPTVPFERQRIKSVGGCVHEGRINGYAVSRAIGDHSVRPFVISEPYIHSFDIEPEIHKFLVLACDGVFDVVSDQMCAEMVSTWWTSTFDYNPDMNTEDRLFLCSSMLRDYAYALMSHDNISCTILKFNPL